MGYGQMGRTPNHGSVLVSCAFSLVRAAEWSWASRQLTMTDKGGSGGSQRAIPQARDALLPDTLPEQLHARAAALRLLRRLDRVDGREGHAERRGRDAGCDGLDEHGPLHRV